MPIVRRSNRAPLRFSGPDAHKLLNDVLTGPMPSTEGPARWWALLSPQGKVQAEGLAGWAEGALWLDIEESIADAFLKRMRIYRLRAKVEIEDLRESHAVGWSASAEGQPPEGTLVQADPRAGGLGFRVIAPLSAAEGWGADGGEFLQTRIATGIAELGADFAPDTMFPHDLAMDILDGIDFAKGCYVGQEVVSRMKHRGTARRRPVLASGVPANVERTILANGREAGTLGAVLDGQAVAIVRLDRIEPGAEISVSGAPVTLSLPTYATYTFGGGGEPEAP